MFKKNMRRHQALCVEYRSRFNFNLTYPLQMEGEKPDALTQSSEDKQDPNNAACQTRTTILTTLVSLVEQIEKMHENMCLLVDILHETGWNRILQLFEGAYQVNMFLAVILKILERGTLYFPKLILTECSEWECRLLYRGPILVLESTELHLNLVLSQHDAPAAEHPELPKTFQLLQREFHW